LDVIEREDVDFLLEVTKRTEADRKGGSLVVRDGRVHLLEIAQVAPEQRHDFMNIRRFPVFNTNNVWVDLYAIDAALSRGDLGLTLIQNRKQIRGRRIIQIETAMGAAIACFPRARALLVGRDRFCPTKRVADLFALRSDACMLDAMDRLRRNPLRPRNLPFMPRVVFGEDFLESPDNIPERFEDPKSVSLLKAHTLEVQGPVFFEKDVVIEGSVVVQAPSGDEFRVPRGSLLKDATYP
jgi:UTP--glucose-1-phosphate uridylyltransferase